MRIHTPGSLLGKLIGVLYKAPGYSIEFELSNGTSDKHRFTPAKAEEGFLISPLIVGNNDFLAAISSTEWQKYQSGEESQLLRVKRFRIQCENIRMAAPEKFQVYLSTVSGLEFGRSR